MNHQLLYRHFLPPCFVRVNVKTKDLEFSAQNGTCNSYKTVLRLLKNALSLNQNALKTKSRPLFASWDVSEDIK
jgi:hypothetical protein